MTTHINIPTGKFFLERALKLRERCWNLSMGPDGDSDDRERFFQQYLYYCGLSDALTPDFEMERFLSIDERDLKLTE